MKKRFHTTQSDLSKGLLTHIEGLQNVPSNSHNQAISQIGENLNVFASMSFENESNDPLNEKLCTDGNNVLYSKVEFISMDDICESVTIESSESEKMEIEEAFTQQYVDFSIDKTENEVERVAEESPQSNGNITHFSADICQFNGEFLSSEGTIEIAEIGSSPYVSEVESSKSQAQFMLNFNLNNGNTNENLESVSVSPIACDELVQEVSEKSMKIENGLNDENGVEICLISTPPSPSAFSECFANEREDFFPQDQTAPLYSTETALTITPDTPKISRKRRNSRRDEEIAMHNYKKKLSRSASSRRSSNSQISEASSSLRSNTDSDRADNCTNSTGILADLNRDDSSSPLLKRKIRKRDIFKDTDGEEEFQASESEEKSSDMDSKKKYVHQTYVSDDETAYPVGLKSSKYGGTKISDFELMMQQKRAERQRSRKRGSDFITLNDDLIDQLIDRMEEAAYEDRQLNKKGLPATKKVSMLKYVVSQLRKKDLQSIFLEHNILSTLTEWLSPLPSKCLPCLQIRESILRLLDDFPRIDKVLLRHSGIGRMLKFLREHPDETKENQERCGLLISKWIRPIHDSSCEYRAMTKKERQERDYELSLRYAKQKKKTQLNCKKIKPNIMDITLSSPSTTEASRPGEPGWIPRARVPQPSVRDYIKRPESKLNCEIFTEMKPSRFEILSKKYQKAKRNKVVQRSGANLSIVGDKM